MTAIPRPLPPEEWGHDHWTTLAYLELARLQQRTFRVLADPGMRTSVRNLMTLLAAREGDEPGWLRPVIALSDKEGSRNRQGQAIVGHDDWDCLRDFAREGLLTLDETTLLHGSDVSFSPKGRVLVEALREHKRTGGGFSDFDIETVSWTPARKPAP